jgi:peroxin-19
VVEDDNNDDSDDHHHHPNKSNDNHDLDPDAFLNGMMEQLLSKELMYEPLKQVTEKFPAWLKAHQNTISSQEWKQRQQQFKIFQQLVQVYEDNDNNNKTDRLMDLMQQLQQFGQPPTEIINEIAPELQLNNEGLPFLDGSSLGGAGIGKDGECMIM